MQTINYPTLPLVEGYLTHYFKTGSKDLSTCTITTGNYIGKGNMALLPKACVPGAYITGIDIPVLINDPLRGAGKTIMIVEQDPLRKIKYFSKLYDKTTLQNNAIVGTPNALHDLKPVTFYLSLVTELIKRGWNVYLTDVYKIYAPGLKGKKGRLTTDEINLLTDELNVIRPTKIILFGKEAQRAFSLVPISYNLGSMKTVPVPHRSARAVCWSYLKTKATDIAKLNYILSLV